MYDMTMYIYLLWLNIIVRICVIKLGSNNIFIYKRELQFRASVRIFSLYSEVLCCLSELYDLQVCTLDFAMLANIYFFIINTYKLLIDSIVWINSEKLLLAHNKTSHSVRLRLCVLCDFFQSSVQTTLS